MSNLEQLLERLELLETRVGNLEDRLNAASSPANEANLRAAFAQSLRNLADDIEEDDELTPAPRVDPNEEE